MRMTEIAQKRPKHPENQRVTYRNKAESDPWSKSDMCGLPTTFSDNLRSMKSRVSCDSNPQTAHLGTSSKGCRLSDADNLSTPFRHPTAAGRRPDSGSAAALAPWMFGVASLRSF